LQITDITIAMHERSSPRLAVFGTRDGKLPMGVLRIATDAGIEGTNFLSYPGPGPKRPREASAPPRSGGPMNTSSSTPTSRSQSPK
jgi:hypothetical protein